MHTPLRTPCSRPAGSCSVRTPRELPGTKAGRCRWALASLAAQSRPWTKTELSGHRDDVRGSKASEGIACYLW